MGRVRYSWALGTVLLAVLAACGTGTDYGAVGGGTSTLTCDGGKTFTVTYKNGYENATIEMDGRKVELTKVRTSIGGTPSPVSGSTGVRYSDESGKALYLARGRNSVLEIDGQHLSNCRDQTASP